MSLDKKVLVLTFFCFFLFSCLIMQLFRIQVVQGATWEKKARGQQETIVDIPFRRGAFFASSLFKGGGEKEPIVFDVTFYHLYIDPFLIPEEKKEKMAKEIFSFLEVKDQDNFFSQFEKKSRSRRIALWLKQEKKEEISHWWKSFSSQECLAKNALYFVTDYKRMYPYGKMLGQVLHTIRDFKDEKTSEGIPTGGLEAYFHQHLKGKLGKRKLLRSPLHRLDLDAVIEEAQDGANIFLTIDMSLQAIMEEELEKGVELAQAKGGWSVMIDPSNGHILALAQVPFFDPSQYSSYFTTLEKMEESKAKAICDAFEMGSIMKPLTVSMALLANEELKKKKEFPIFDPKEMMQVSCGLFPGRKHKPLKDTPMHKAITMEMAIQKSSNIYMAELADRIVQKMGPQWYREKLVETFGLSKKTKVELPSESPGVLPRFGFIHPNGKLEWSKATPYSLAIGYNVMATSVQMARAYCVLANGGYLVEPTLIRKIEKNHEIILDHSMRKKEDFPCVLTKEIAQQVVRAMKFTTKVGGSGRLADIPGYTEAGKTGTAEKIEDGQYAKQKHLSSFVGMAPAQPDHLENTRFVLIVTIDEPKWQVLQNGVKMHMGGRCAAPTFERIAARSLKAMGVAPDDPYGYPVTDIRFDPTKADWLFEVDQLKKLYDKAHQK